jgi:hypothetical protein
MDRDSEIEEDWGGVVVTWDHVIFLGCFALAGLMIVTGAFLVNPWWRAELFGLE